MPLHRYKSLRILYQSGLADVTTYQKIFLDSTSRYACQTSLEADSRGLVTE
jgi:hypothetical protein